MKAAPNGLGSDPRRLRIEDLQDPTKAEEALSNWDELEPAVLSAIEAHPQHGPRLAMLRRADRWLEKRGPTLRPAGACPTAEELYDFGRGPGYGPLSNTRRSEIERHLSRCRDCEATVETLASPPPVPLDVETGPRSAAAGRTSRPPRFRPLPRLVPLAIAASLVAALGVWIALVPSGPPRLTFPQAPLLRGSSGGPLYFPRDRILRPSADAAATFPSLALSSSSGALVFEIEPQTEATLYRIDLARHDGDAFASEEENLATLSEPTPTLRATLDLPPGHYTWTARAVVRGLDRVLGARDFEVVEDGDTNRRLADLAGRAEPERSLAAVRLLHDRGFLADARAIARTMPASAERDAYLGQVPGR